MTNKASLDALIENVRELAERHPDRVQQGACRYYRRLDRKPSCIVGHAIDPLIDDRTRYRLMSTDANEGPVGHLFGEFTEACDPHSAGAKWLRRVQACQDNGDSWGRAVEFADREVEIKGKVCS